MATPFVGYNSASDLTRGHLLARNTIWNLTGQIVPMFVAVLTIPAIVRGIGLERFGILTLGWVIVGYFSLFDLGLGRALTKLVSDRLAAGPDRNLCSLIWTSSLLMLVLGLVAGLVMFILSPWLVTHVLKIPANLRVESRHALYVLAFSVPIVTSTSGFRGVLEALQHFHTVNLIRIPMSVSVFLGPVLVLFFSTSLVPMFAIMVAGRLIAWVAYIWACFTVLPELRKHADFRSSEINDALRFGGWITANNLIVPLMVYVDRFVIGALLSVRDVAFYTTPFEAISKLLLVPGAVAGVMFPAFAVSYANDKHRAGFLLQRGVKYNFLILFPTVLVAIAFAPEGLRLWVGPIFAQNSAGVLKVLAAGVFINCLAQLPLSLVQGSGRPDIAAKLQAAELPFFLAGIFWATKHYGLTGAAIAWSLRVSLDAILLFAIAFSLLPHRRGLALRLGVSIAAALSMFYVVTVPTSVQMRGLLVSLVLVGWVWTAWFRILLEEERDLLRNLILRRSKVAA